MPFALRIFTNMKYAAAASRATGVKFYDSAGSRRDPLVVLNEIRQRYSSLKSDIARDLFVQTAFGAADLDTIKGIRTLLNGSSLAQVGQMATVIGEAGGTLKRDMDEASQNLVDQVGRLGNVLKQAFDEGTEPLRQTLVDVIRWGLDKHPGGLGLSGGDIAGYGAGGAAGTYALAKIGGRFIGLGASGTAAALAWGIPTSIFLSDQARGHGWGSRTIGAGSREYEVMGIGRSRVNNVVNIDLSFDGSGRVFSSVNGLNNAVNVSSRGDYGGLFNSLFFGK